VREAIRSGKTIILTIDVQGGIQVHRLMPEATFVLVLPPTAEDLSRRLNGRGTDTPEVIAARLAKAQAEIAAAQASGAYKYTVINDDLEKAVQQVVDIVEGRS
jgi:guanylate kinase